MNADKNKDNLLPPDEYRERVKSVHFSTIYFKRGDWSIHRDALAETNELAMDFAVTEANLQESCMEFTQHFYAHVIPEGKKRPAVTIECDIVTECLAEEEQPDAFWETYKQMTLPVITVPFFREFVHTLSSKMGIPPIIVPPWVR